MKMKKLLAILLALVMLLGMLPAVALAEGSESTKTDVINAFATLAKKLDEAKNGDEDDPYYEYTENVAGALEAAEAAVAAALEDGWTFDDIQALDNYDGYKLAMALRLEDAFAAFNDEVEVEGYDDPISVAALVRDEEDYTTEVETVLAAVEAALIAAWDAGWANDGGEIDVDALQNVIAFEFELYKSAQLLRLKDACSAFDDVQNELDDEESGKYTQAVADALATVQPVVEAVLAAGLSEDDLDGNPGYANYLRAMELYDEAGGEPIESGNSPVVEPELDPNGCTVLYLDKGSITIGNGTVSGYSAGGAEITTPNDTGYIITQSNAETPTANLITVTGGSHQIILRGVNMLPANDYDSAIMLSGTACTTPAIS